MVTKEMKEKGNIGERLKELRTSKGISIEELAAAINISKNKLRRIENDKSQATITVLANLAIYFNTKPSYLLKLNDEPQKK